MGGDRITEPYPTILKKPRRGSVYLKWYQTPAGLFLCLWDYSRWVSVKLEGP